MYSVDRLARYGITQLLSESAEKVIGKRSKKLSDLTSVEWARFMTEFYTRLHNALPNDNHLDQEIRIAIFLATVRIIGCPLGGLQIQIVVDTAESVIHASHD